MDDLALVIEEIRQAHRRRIFAMDMRKIADLKIGAYLRTQLGWTPDMPAAERNAIAKHAQELIAIGEKLAKEHAKPEAKRKEVPGADDGDFVAHAAVIGGSIAARAPFDAIESGAEKRLAELAQSLPVWPWCEPIRGFGPLSLATIVAEAGDLSIYANPAKLWKRLGLAVIDGVRQGGLSKTAGKDAWIEHGYNRERRSRMWNIGKALVYAGGEYADLYRQRKEYERAKAEAAGLTVKPAGEIRVKERASCMSLGHVDKRGQRYMEKRIVRDLWRAWRATDVRRGTILHMEPTGVLSPAPSHTEIAAE